MDLDDMLNKIADEHADKFFAEAAKLCNAPWPEFKDALQRAFRAAVKDAFWNRWYDSEPNQREISPSALAYISDWHARRLHKEMESTNAPRWKYMTAVRETIRGAIDDALGTQWLDPKSTLPESGQHCVVAYRVQGSSLFPGVSGIQCAEYCGSGSFNPKILNVVAWMAIPPLPERIISNK